MYQNIIFDLYGTLVDIKTDESKQSFWEELSLFLSYNGAKYSYHELKNRYSTIVERKLLENTKTDYPDTKIMFVFKELYEEKGVHASDELLLVTTRVFRATSTEYICLYPGVTELLETLIKKGKKLFILSNGQREFSHPELQHLGIYHYFKTLYSSSEIGICKPDKAFYEYLVQREAIHAKDSLFVGNDYRTDIAGAIAFGMDSVYIHSNQSGNVNKTDATYEIWDGDVTKVLQYAL